MSGPSATQNTDPCQSEASWSRSERAIARRVLDAALKRELRDVMREAKQMANRIVTLDGMGERIYLTSKVQEAQIPKAVSSS